MVTTVIVCIVIMFVLGGYALKENDRKWEQIAKDMRKTMTKSEE